MNSRLRKTLADYLVIAISPVLIMFLVGSLLFFLVEVFYQGAYSGRLHFVLALFVLAIVLIGRISIEMGSDHAVMYGLALALVTALALWRFVQFHGALAGFSLFVNLGLMGLVWWVAHRLTWDCTLIDESEDASGQGLMQTIGLDDQPNDDQPDPNQPDPNDLDSLALPGQETRGWRERLLDKKQSRPHAPGLWVVYVSLAALPLFGIGQWFIPNANIGARRHAFFLLLIYVACGLCLLLTTSFLGLRRYLRQRQIEMPPAMAGLWVALGCGLIVVLLALAAVLPRPNAEYDLAKLPFSVGSPTRESSRNAVMKGEAADRDAEGPRSGSREKEPEPSPDHDSPDDSPSNQPGSGSGAKEQGPGSGSQSKSHTGTSGEGESEEPEGGGSKGSKGGGSKGSKSGGSKESKDGGSKESQGGGSKESKDGGSKGSKDGGSKESKDGGSKDPQGGQKGGSDSERAEKDDHDSSSNRESTKRENGSQGAGRSSGSQSGQRNEDRSQKEETKEEEEDNQSGPGSGKPPSFDPAALLQSATQSLSSLFKWVLYIILLVAIGYGLWRHRADLAAALKGFLDALRHFWSTLLGAGSSTNRLADSADAEAARNQKAFSDFRDPFATGRADTLSTDEVISYTFEALEAWARDHGYPRVLDQTPHEFARALSRQVPSLSERVQRLADLYCRAAYAPGMVPKAAIGPLEPLWRALRESEWSRV